MDNKPNIEPSGVLIVDKPQGFTSHDVINKIRRLFSTRRVGHTGTLDPLATGVLVVLVGRAAKAAEYLSADTKRYTATLRLGIQTDTEDITGNVTRVCESIPSTETVLAVSAKFTGDILQIPPMYSALKVDGKKLCDLARSGKEVRREARQITIHSLTLTPTDKNTDYIAEVFCSSGTYIRTLCADIGNSLGCGGAMATLRREAAGEFSIENSFTLDALAQMSDDERRSTLLPIESLFTDLPTVKLPAFYEKLSRSGCEIYQKKLRTDFCVGARVRMCDENGHFYALGEVFDYPDGSAIKSIKLFEL